jgi:hypothetical protein
VASGVEIEEPIESPSQSEENQTLVGESFGKKKSKSTLDKTPKK